MNKQHAMVVAGIAAFAILPLTSLAQDISNGASDIAYNASADGTVYRPATCAEARAAAWLNRQLEITDGDVSPKVPEPAECSGQEGKMLAATDEVY